MFDTLAKDELLSAVDHELWLLEFLEKQYECFLGGAAVGRLEVNRHGGVALDCSVSDNMATQAAQPTVDAMSALTFVTCYKVLDLLFIWILTENKVSKAGVRPFAKKVELLSAGNLTYPPILEKQTFLREYTSALYSGLLDFRNAVIHRSSFSVKRDMLEVFDRQGGALTLDRAALGCLVRYSIGVVKLVAGTQHLTEQLEVQLKHCLDQLASGHAQPKFGVAEPLVVTVVVELEEVEGKFRLDLGHLVRLSQDAHPARHVLTQVEVVGLRPEKEPLRWTLPDSIVHGGGEVELTAPSSE